MEQKVEQRLMDNKRGRKPDIRWKDAIKKFDHSHAHHGRCLVRIFFLLPIGEDDEDYNDNVHNLKKNRFR